MGTRANSEDPDEMQHIAAFHQGLHCLLRLQSPSGTEINLNLENASFHPQILALVLQEDCFWKNYLFFLDFTCIYERTSGILSPLKNSE